MDKILIVEDSPTQSARLEYILESAGYQVIAATNGKEALRLLGSENPTLVISDVMMPEMDGYTFASLAKQDDAVMDIPIILLTSLADPEDVIHGLESGADNFVAKPYSPEYLLDRIDHVLTNRALYKREVARTEIEISIAGHSHRIAAKRQQILNFLLSTYETAVQKNNELVSAQDELRTMNAQLEEKVDERTSALKAEIVERQLAEKKLLWLASFPVHNPNPIIEADISGVVTYLNPAAERDFPKLRETGVGHPLLRGLGELLPQLRSGDKRTIAREVALSGRIFEENIWYVSDPELIRVFVLDVTDKRQIEETIKERDRAIRQAYVEVISAVTGGRLIIMSSEEISSALGDTIAGPMLVKSGADLASTRELVRTTLDRHFPEHPAAEDIVLAVNEAVTNTIKHAGGGSLQLFRRKDMLQVLINDTGDGIDFGILPKATLVSGFSTKPSLGMGFSIMLEMCDRVLLSSEPGNTSVVLEVSEAQENDASQGMFGGLGAFENLTD